MPDHPEPVPSKLNRTDTFIIGTRGSQLATTQSGLIRDLLAELHGGDGLEVILETIRTSGDVNRASLSEIGGQGLFTAEIERALLDGRIALAVHSLKDLPTQIPADLQLVATPERADVRDVLVTREPVSGIDDLARGAQLGTGSPRRVAQLMSVRPDLRFADDVHAALRSADWPGNVRQLENLVQEAAILSRESVIYRRDLEHALPLATEPNDRVANRAAKRLDTDEVEERDQIAAALAAGDPPEQIAEAQGVSRATIYRRMQAYGLERP